MKGTPMAHTSDSISTTDRSYPSSSSELWQGLQSPLTFGLVICGGIGAVLFTAVYLIEGFTRPGYDAWLQPISSLSLGPGGWVQQVNFVVFGALSLLSAVGWYRLLLPWRALLWFPLFQGISGLCLIGTGVFSLDPLPGYPPGATPGPSTLHARLHTIFAWAIIISLALGCFSLGGYLWRLPHWRGWGVYTYLTGFLILIFWGAFQQGASGNVAWLTPVTGLTECLSAGSHALWMCVLVATLFFVRQRQRIASSTPT
jgi:Protein of unknown function (DUF998)